MLELTEKTNKCYYSSISCIEKAGKTMSMVVRRQIKCYKIKIKICKMKSLLYGINVTLNSVEENISIKIP